MSIPIAITCTNITFSSIPKLHTFVALGGVEAAMLYFFLNLHGHV